MGGVSKEVRRKCDFHYFSLFPRNTEIRNGKSLQSCIIFCNRISTKQWWPLRPRRGGGGGGGEGVGVVGKTYIKQVLNLLLHL